MSDPVKTRRSYDASRRQEQARANRHAVLEAARAAFLTRGYASSTVAEIARAAGVSVETVYKAFRNKPGILKAMFDVALVGDDEPVPMMQRDFVRRNMAEPDPQKKLRDYARHVCRLAPAVMPVQLLARDAAAGDPGAAEVWTQMREERLTGMSFFAAHLAEGGHLRRGVSVEDARDVLWTFNSPELWELLVVVRGWSPTKYARWMGDQLVAALVS